MKLFVGKERYFLLEENSVIGCVKKGEEWKCWKYRDGKTEELKGEELERIVKGIEELEKDMEHTLGEGEKLLKEMEKVLSEFEKTLSKL